MPGKGFTAEDAEMKALMIDVVNKQPPRAVLFDERLGSELIQILTQQDQ
jgi:hypothetical protein